MDWFWMIPFILIASIVKGLTGMGLSVLLFPFMLMLFPVKEVVPILALFNLLTSLQMLFRVRAGIALDPKLRSLNWIAVGAVVAGVWIFVSWQSNYIEKAMGVLFLLWLILSFFTSSKETEYTILSYRWAGLLVGIAGSVSLTGPVLALILKRFKTDVVVFRKEFAWLSLFLSAIAMVGYGIGGLLTTVVWQITLGMIPVLLLGGWIGEKLSDRLSSDKFYQIIYIVTLFSTLYLLFK
ncbi:sulfite exporter TauE/SafE family protein [Prolixibacteraceae bacterium]|nr:sulfite exporter TauE/SafE family protein [Prolixibacteraceae bacterium]